MAIALAQSNISANSDSAGSQGTAYSSSLTNGSILVCIASQYDQFGTSSALTISDTGSHSWTAICDTLRETTEGSVKLRAWWAPNTATNTPTVTVACTSNGWFVVAVHEFTGVDTTTPLDGVTPVTHENVSWTSSPQTQTAGPTTPNSNNAWLVAGTTAYFAGSGDPTISVTNGTEMEESEAWSTTMLLATAYEPQVTAASESITWSWTGTSVGSSAWNDVQFVLKPDSTGTDANITAGAASATATAVAPATVTAGTSASITGVSAATASATAVAPATVTAGTSASITGISAATASASAVAPATVTAETGASVTGISAAAASASAVAPATVTAGTGASITGISAAASTAFAPGPTVEGDDRYALQVAVNGTTLELSWNSIDGATGYDIERDSVIIVEDHQTNSYDDTGLDETTEYDYRVRAVMS